MLTNMRPSLPKPFRWFSEASRHASYRPNLRPNLSLTNHMRSVSSDPAVVVNCASLRNNNTSLALRALPTQYSDQLLTMVYPHL